jgi:isopenicillin N synthase-like dioxygenase
MEVVDAPIINVAAFLNDTEEKEAECKKVADSLHKYGILILNDPRIEEKDNDEYIEMMEKYFENRGDQFYNKEELKEARPDIHYQVGITPEYKEKARNHCKRFAHYDENNKPISECPPEFDAKWRYFWHIGERPEERKEANANIVPADFPEWEQKMDKWGNMMISACMTAAEMTALGLGIEQETFSSKMKQGPHLLAPTGSDLTKNDNGTVFAGVHYDLNFLTIHGKSRFPGLFIWLKDGTKMAVKVPDGCLLIQSGIQIEWMTGGYIKAGFHEVIYTDATKEIVNKRMEENKDAHVWRVSSTLFSHIKFDQSLAPLESLKEKWDEGATEKYNDITSEEKTLEELKAISLHAEAATS